MYRGTPRAERHARARAALDSVGLRGWEHHTPNELSGGQAQRVAIARAIVAEPSVLFADEPTGNLDTARSREIMDLLVRFNREHGITILMVTHEPAWRRYTSRTIKFRDGQVESDEERTDAVERPQSGAARDRRNVLRSSLTTLGIIIGVSAVIIMVTLGNGATAAVTADIANLGSNLLTVMPGQRVGPGGASGGAKPFKQRDVHLLRRDVTAVGAVAPLSSQGMSAWSATRIVRLRSPGPPISTSRPAAGNLPADASSTRASFDPAPRCVSLGKPCARNCSERRVIVGERLRLRAVSCEVIGLLRSKGKNPFGMDRDDAGDHAGADVPAPTVRQR